MARSCRRTRQSGSQVAKVAHHVIAIDIDPNLLEVARHRLNESGVTNCGFVAGDAYDLAKLVLARADFVFMANAFHGVPDRRATSSRKLRCSFKNKILLQNVAE